jgi:hypothetical protein
MNIKPSLSVSTAMSKYIMDCTNKSMENRIKKINKDFQPDKIVTDVYNVDVKNTIFACTFFSFISFLAGYHFKSLQN